MRNQRVIHNSAQNRAKVRVEMHADMLSMLIEKGLLCVADLRCLDADSRNQIKQLCLSVCARRSGCEFPHREASLLGKLG